MYSSPPESWSARLPSDALASGTTARQLCPAICPAQRTNRRPREWSCEPTAMCPERHEFESRTRIRIVRGVRAAAIAQIPQFAANLECGVRASAQSLIPPNVPTKVVDAGGSLWTSLEHARTREQPKNQASQSFARRRWTSLDVLGCPWMSLDGSPGRIRSLSQIVELMRRKTARSSRYPRRYPTPKRTGIAVCYACARVQDCGLTQADRSM
jgi:hypothetical protein